MTILKALSGTLLGLVVGLLLGTSEAQAGVAPGSAVPDTANPVARITPSPPPARQAAATPPDPEVHRRAVEMAMARTARYRCNLGWLRWSDIVPPPGQSVAFVNVALTGQVKDDKAQALTKITLLVAREPWPSGQRPQQLQPSQRSSRTPAWLPTLQRQVAGVFPKTDWETGWQWLSGQIVFETFTLVGRITPRVWVEVTGRGDEATGRRELLEAAATLANKLESGGVEAARVDLESIVDAGWLLTMTAAIHFCTPGPDGAPLNVELRVGRTGAGISKYLFPAAHSGGVTRKRIIGGLIETQAFTWLGRVPAVATVLSTQIDPTGMLPDLEALGATITAFVGRYLVVVVADEKLRPKSAMEAVCWVLRRMFPEATEDLR